MKKFIIVLLVVLLLVLSLTLCGCEEETIEESSWSRFLSENLDKLITLITVLSGVFGGVVLSVFKIVKGIKEVRAGIADVEECKSSFIKANEDIDSQQERYIDTLKKLSEVITAVQSASDRINQLMDTFDDSKKKELKALQLALTNNGELIKKGIASEIGLLLENENEKGTL